MRSSVTVSHSFLKQHPSCRGFSESWGGMWRSLTQHYDVGIRIKGFLEALLSIQDFIAGFKWTLFFVAQIYESEEDFQKTVLMLHSKRYHFDHDFGEFCLSPASAFWYEKDLQLPSFLGGAFKRCFTRKPGEIIQFDNHVFQIGWFNHPPSFGIPGVFVVNSKVINPQRSPLEQKNRSPKIDQNSCIPEV